ncbi:MAG: hypothetical protein ACRCX2_38550 [Paraclostridium sp.]
MKITYEYLKDPNHLADPMSEEHELVFCIEDGCDNVFAIHNGDEISNVGRWYCPEHITEERFAQMEREGFL